MIESCHGDKNLLKQSAILEVLKYNAFLKNLFKEMMKTIKVSKKIYRNLYLLIILMSKNSDLEAVNSVTNACMCAKEFFRLLKIYHLFLVVYILQHLSLEYYLLVVLLQLLLVFNDL